MKRVLTINPFATSEFDLQDGQISDFKRALENQRKVLFCTDLSTKSEGVFSVFTDILDANNQEVILFHAITLPQLASAGPVYSHAMDLLPHDYWIKQEQWANEKAKQFVKVAENKGIKIKVIIHNKVVSQEEEIAKLVKAESEKMLTIMSTKDLLKCPMKINFEIKSPKNT